MVIENIKDPDHQLTFSGGRQLTSSDDSLHRFLIEQSITQVPLIKYLSLSYYSSGSVLLEC